eukprot:scaffold111089_cov21-Tisochrysis_lutea.AAC.1
MYEIAQENKRLSEPLTKALKEVEALRHAVANYDKDKMSLAQTKVRAGVQQKWEGWLTALDLCSLHARTRVAYPVRSLPCTSFN